MATPTFSANLGFLWTDRALPDAIRAAAAAGFDAVECHQPFATPALAVRDALDEVSLELVSLNAALGDRPGDFGLLAVPTREDEALSHVDQALAYATAVGARFVSLFSGRTGRTAQAEATLRRNLVIAAERARQAGCALVLEPLSTAGEDYHLRTVDQAVDTLAAVDVDNVWIMADTFHVLRTDGSLDTIGRNLDRVGHIQISGWPDRGEPDHGIDFADVLPGWIAAGYGGTYGAEYTPATSVEAGLDWLRAWRAN